MAAKRKKKAARRAKAAAAVASSPPDLPKTDQRFGLAITITDQVAEEKGGWGNPPFEQWLEEKVEEALDKLQEHVEGEHELDFYHEGTLKITEWDSLVPLGILGKCKRVFWVAGKRDPESIVLPPTRAMIEQADVRKDI